MFLLEGSDAPIEIEILIEEELEQTQEFTKKNSEKINEYENSLLKRLQNFQKPAQKDLYNKTINEISEYLKSFKSKDSFIVNIISYLKLADLENFYINWIIKTSNKEVIKASISRLISERVRIFNHLELTKTLFLAFNNNLTNKSDRKEDIYLLFNKFNDLLLSEQINIGAIKILNLGWKKQEKILSITKDNIKDKIENIVVSPKEEVKKRQAWPKRTGIQTTWRWLLNKTTKPAKAEKSPRLSAEQKEEKSKQASLLKEAEKNLRKANKIADNKKELAKKQEERKKRKDIIEEKKQKISLLRKLQKIHGKILSDIEKIKKVKAKKAEKNIIEDTLFLSFWDKITDEQSKIFFEKLNAFRKSRRTDKSILSDKTYISFMGKASDKDFYKLLDIEQLTINWDKLDNKIVLQIFKRLISFSKEKLVELDRFKWHKRRINTMKSKLDWFVDVELENTYEMHLNDIETTNIVKVPKTKEEKIIIEDTFFLIFWDKITDDQSTIFFEKLAEFRSSRRKNTEILSEKTYLSFIQKCNNKDLIDILNIERLTIYKNLISLDILKVFLQRLTKMTVEIGNWVNLLKRVKNIRSKILEKTWLDKLDDEAEKEFINFETRYLEAKKWSKTIVDNSSSWSQTSIRWKIYHKHWSSVRVKAISYHEDEKEKIKLAWTIKYLFDNFIKFRTKTSSMNLFNLIDEERKNPIISSCLFDFLNTKDFDIIRDFFLEDDNFFEKSENYILWFYNIFENEWFADDFAKLLINNLDKLNDYLIKNIISQYNWEYIEYIESYLNRHEIEREKQELEENDRKENIRNLLLESIPSKLTKLAKTQEIESAKKELISFFEDFEKIEDENWDIYEKLTKEKLAIILDNKMLFTGFIWAINWSYKHLFTKIYSLLDIEKISNNNPHFILILLQISLNIKEFEQAIFLKNLCDTKNISYKFLEKDLKNIEIINETKQIVEKIMNHEILEKDEIEWINDYKIISAYINKLIEKDDFDRVLEILKSKKKILNINFVTQIVSQVKNQEKLRNFIMTF